MSILLDTHALAWWLLADRQLSDRARAAIAQSNRICVSSISAFEMATKHRAGKWPGIGNLLLTFEKQVQAQGFEILDLTPRHSIRAGLMAGDHRDPFDRLLAAQAEIENLTLVTRDPAFASFGVVTLW